MPSGSGAHGAKKHSVLAIHVPRHKGRGADAQLVHIGKGDCGETQGEPIGVVAELSVVKTAVAHFGGDCNRERGFRHTEVQPSMKTGPEHGTQPDPSRAFLHKIISSWPPSIQVSNLSFSSLHFPMTARKHCANKSPTQAAASRIKHSRREMSNGPQWLEGQGRAAGQRPAQTKEASHLCCQDGARC
jgi:hypothetical protein